MYRSPDVTTNSKLLYSCFLKLSRQYKRVLCSWLCVVKVRRLRSSYGTAAHRSLSIVARGVNQLPNALVEATAVEVVPVLQVAIRSNVAEAEKKKARGLYTIGEHRP